MNTRKYTLSEIRSYTRDGLATDITNWSFGQVKQLQEQARLEKIGYSSGKYGINGCIVQDAKTGDLYAVTARNSTLFQVW